MTQTNTNNDQTSHKNCIPQPGRAATQKLVSLGEAARFLGFKKSYLYKLTSTKQIPHYKSGGRIVVFDFAALQEWRAARLQYIPTQEEQEAAAAAYCAANPLQR